MNRAAGNAQPVKTRDGAEGVTIGPAQAGRVTVRFSDGATIVIAENLLQRQPNGSLLIPVSRADLTAPESTVLATNETVVPVAEERVQVRKRQVETGEVVVHVTPHLREERIDVDLAEEQVEVERVPVNEFVQHPIEVRQEGSVTIVPIVEEVLVVEKRLMLREEIRLTRIRRTRPHSEQVTLRTEEARVLRSGNSPT